jgi:hypothetical protein
MSRSLLAVGGLLLALGATTPTYAQTVVSPDFANQVQTTLPSNEQLVGQLQDALGAADDLSVTSGGAEHFASIGEALNAELERAMIAAPDDAARSRIEGVLTHTRAAVASLRMAKTDTPGDAVRGRLLEAQGEAREALDELRPYILGLVASGVITGK